MSQHKPTIFMTGATGLLGHFVLRDLLLRGRRVVAMLRAPLAGSRARLDALLTGLGMESETYCRTGQLEFVEGSLPERPPAGDWGQTDEILSCAASLQLFANGNDEPFKTNVEGTQALIDWARARNVRRIHAVSTAYVCGWRSADVREVFHHPEPEFGTVYEQSKWRAEALLEHWSREPGHCLTVYRPSFIVGDSTTGYTTQFSGFYQVARLVSVLKEQYAPAANGCRTNGHGHSNGCNGAHNGVAQAHNGNGKAASAGDDAGRTFVPLRIPARKDDSQNLVPVDFAARLIAEIVARPQWHGRIYHLTDPQPPVIDDFKRALEDYFQLTGGYFVDPAAMHDERSAAESLLWDKFDVLPPRMTQDPHFDQSNTREVLSELGLEFPRIDQRMFFTFLDYAVRARWGQRNGHRNGARRKAARAARSTAP